MRQKTETQNDIKAYVITRLSRNEWRKSKERDLDTDTIHKVLSLPRI